MIDVSQSIPQEVFMLVFPYVAYAVTQVAKRFHTSPMTVWWGVCFLVSALYVSTMWYPTVTWWEFALQLIVKVGLVFVGSAGLWHLVKKLTGQTEQERNDDIATGVAAGIAIAGSDNEEGTIEVESIRK